MGFLIFIVCFALAFIASWTAIIIGIMRSIYDEDYEDKTGNDD